MFEGAATIFGFSIFTAFLLPGFFALTLYRLLDKFDLREPEPLKGWVIEAAAFGALNFIVSWPILAFILIREDPVSPWFFSGSLLIIVFVFPAIASFIVLFVVQFSEQKGWIARSAPPAWDAYFRRGRYAWLIVHLTDGRRIGGWFGKKSYASLSPNPGHLYMEEVWKLDDSGRFLEKIEATEGVIITPDKYDFVEVYDADGYENEE